MHTSKNRSARRALGVSLVAVSITIAGSAAFAQVASGNRAPVARPNAAVAATWGPANTEGLKARVLADVLALNAHRAAARARRHRLWLRPPAPVAHQRGVDWSGIAACESGGRWHVHTGNGYWGGLQFSQDTWVRAGGLRFAPRADLAFPAEQIRVAARLSLSSWPICGSRG